MNEPKVSNSDSDVSECNSWTVLCNCEESDNPNDEKCCSYESFSDLEILENHKSFKNIPESKCNSSKNETKSTLDQNNSLINHKIVHDYEDNKDLIKTHFKCKSKRKRRVKNKSYNIGTLFIIGTIVTVTSALLLCFLTPKSVNLNPSTLNNLDMVKDGSVKQQPIKTIISKCKNKLEIQDKESSLKTHLENQGFPPNNTNFLDPSLATHQQFKKNVNEFNKRYGKPSILNRDEIVIKQAKKSSAILPTSSRYNAKALKLNDKVIPIENSKTTKKLLITDSLSKTQTHKEDETLLQYKIICNVLQDLALLRLTQVVAKQLADKVAKRKKKFTLKTNRRKKAALKRQKPLIKINKQNTSSTALMLWDELPFNKEILSKQAITNIIKKNDVQKVNSRVSLTEITKTTTKNQLLEKHHKRQLDYLEKLKQEHNNRIAYLKSVRERQQKSIQALIQERKQDFNRLNVYNEKQHMMEGLEIKNHYKKLKNNLASKSISDFNHQVNNESKFCKKFNSLLNISNSNGENNQNNTLTLIPIISRKINLFKEKTKNSTKYLNTRKKYYEQITGYWCKQEEYLNERINFMKKASGSLKEVMCNYRKFNINYTSNNKCVSTSLISNGSLVISKNTNLQQLKSETEIMDASSSLTSKDIHKEKSSLQLYRNIK